MRLSKLASKFQFGRLRDYGYKILGRIKGVNQTIDRLILSDGLMARAEDALKSSPLETTVFFFGRKRGKTLLATDILIPAMEDYEKRTFGHVHVSQSFIIREFPKLEKRGKTLLVTMHSHPMDVLSFGDFNTHMNVVKYYPDQLSGIYNNGKIFFYRFENGMKLTPYKTLDLSRFDRQTRAFGEEGQLLISASTVALIGVGGGNTKIASDLASLGVGRLVLIDPDVWEEHNRNRVFIPPDFIGKSKSQSIKRLMEQYYSDVEVEAYEEKAQEVPESVYADSDILVAGPDNIMTRVFCNRLALRLKKPAVFPGAGIDSKDNRLNVMGGSVQVVIPDKSPCYECVASINQLDIMRETLDSESKKKLTEKYGLGVLLDIPTTPSIACLNDVIGGITLWEIMKLITGIEPSTHYQIYDALKAELKPVKITKKSNCPACAERKVVDEVIQLVEDPEELLSALAKGDET